MVAVFFFIVLLIIWHKQVKILEYKTSAGNPVKLEN